MGSKLTGMRLWIEGRSLLELGWLPVIIWVESMVLCVRRCYISDSALVEAMAARKRVEFARRLGLWSFTLEGDSILIVESLKKYDV